MTEYIIPANSKKGQLLFNLFRPIDLWILVIGGIATLILFFVFGKGGIFLTVASLIPIAIALILVYPVANYHNVLVFLQEIFLFYMSQRQFSWKGWCVRSGTETEQGR